MTDISESGIEAALLPCPWCGLTEHLSTKAVGSMHSSMPGRPYRVVCHNAEHDSVEGPVEYGPHGAVAAWNRRHPPASRDEGLTVKPLEWGDAYTDIGGYISFDAKSIVGGYAAYRVQRSAGWVAERVGSGANLGAFDTEADAKSAAQEDYQNRVLSAIETALIPTKPEAKER